MASGGLDGVRNNPLLFPASIEMSPVQMGFIFFNSISSQGSLVTFVTILKNLNCCGPARWAILYIPVQ
jgi:hypothetical protein